MGGAGSCADLLRNLSFYFLVIDRYLIRFRIFSQVILELVSKKKVTLNCIIIDMIITTTYSYQQLPSLLIWTTLGLSKRCVVILHPFLVGHLTYCILSYLLCQSA